MKPLNPLLTEELEKNEYVPTLLIEFSISGFPFRFTQWNHPVLYVDRLFSPRGFQTHGVQLTEENKTVSLSIDDVDEAIYAILGKTNTGVFPFKIWSVVLTTWSVPPQPPRPTGKVISGMVLFSGNINQWNYSPGSIRMSVSADLYEQGDRITTSMLQGSCRWRVFKGKECRYNGAGAECDRTYGQCETYGNELHFGGARWLSSMINKRATQ